MSSPTIGTKPQQQIYVPTTVSTQGTSSVNSSQSTPTPSGNIQLGGFMVTVDPTLEKNEPGIGTDSQKVIEQSCNSGINILNSAACPVREGPMSSLEAKQLNNNCDECLRSKDSQNIRNLNDNINQIIDSGLPSDTGSLGDIATAILILQLKSAMEGKQANREMSAEMASTIYQKSKEIASMILEKGEIAFKQAISVAVTSLVGTAFSSGMTIAGTIKANRKQDNGAQEINTGFDSKRNFRLDDTSRNALIQKYNAIGGLGNATTTAMKGVIDAISSFDIAKLESSIRDLEALNRLNENTQQSVKDVAESFTVLAKFCLQMMKEINSLENQGIMTIQNKM